MANRTIILKDAENFKEIVTKERFFLQATG